MREPKNYAFVCTGGGALVSQARRGLGEGREGQDWPAGGMIKLKKKRVIAKQEEWAIIRKFK